MVRKTVQWPKYILYFDWTMRITYIAGYKSFIYGPSTANIASFENVNVQTQSNLMQNTGWVALGKVRYAKTN